MVVAATGEEARGEARGEAGSGTAARVGAEEVAAEKEGWMA